ncbi:MAG: carbohydrate ABC transporter permease [Desertimonas sp.]
MTIDDVRVDDAAVTTAASTATTTTTQEPGRRTPTSIIRTVIVSALVVLGVWYIGWDTTADTLQKVIIAVGISALLFVAANRLFDLAYTRWTLFNALAGFAMGFLGFMIAENNGALRSLSDRIILFEGKRVTLLGLFGPYDSLGPYDINPWLWGLIGGMAVGAVMLVLSAPRAQLGRLPLSAIGFTAIGIVAFLALRDDYRPTIDWPKTIICTAGGVALFGGIRSVKGPRELTTLTALSGGVIGYTIGAWGGGDIGRGNALGALLATVVPGALLGIRVGLAGEATNVKRRAIEQRSRSWIFVLPAMAFIAGGLIFPLIRTAWLSFRDDSGQEAVGFVHYYDIFTDRGTLDLRNWTDLFTSRLFFIAIAFAVIGVAVGLWTGARNRSGFERNSATATWAIAGFIFGCAVFAAVRGTISNNLWWVLVVTVLATVLGLAVAVLADRSKGENVAKSLIFLPMAISFVGAGIIWRFMYQARPPSRNQTGVLNALWVGLGELSFANNVWHWLVALMLLAALAGCVLLLIQAIGDDKGVMGGASAFGAIVLAYLLYRFVGPGLGGMVENADGAGVAEPVLFLEDRPFNNMWLMVVLIWIQTGFAMVILSSAIKAVPTEYVEAAKMDGATESQIFWKITIPSIMPTLGVVVTTLMITVLKVFDIVRVMTGGVNDTEVIANAMITSFGEGNFGIASALAMILFVAVLPIMYINIRRMRNQ